MSTNRRAATWLYEEVTKKVFVGFLFTKFFTTIFFITEHKSVLPITIKIACKYGPYMYHYPIKAHLKFIKIIPITISEAYLESKC